MSRPVNFYPGPGALPLPVLERVREELLDYEDTGLCVMELSHRSPHIIRLIDDTVARIKRLLGVGEDFDVLLLQGGASLQFCMIPMNLSAPGQKVAYVDTGYWATKAMEEAGKMHREVQVVASSREENYTFIPRLDEVEVDAKYLHICSNNTIYGTAWDRYPRVNVPLAVDMSSDIMSRVVDCNTVDLAYAHAQKTLGPAGVTVVLLKRGLYDRMETDIPNILSYAMHAKHNSNYHTPPCFAIYVMNRVLQWIENDIGGLAALEKINAEKASLLYECIDASKLFSAPAQAGSRSRMNVVFTVDRKDLEEDFIGSAERAGIVGLRGHRRVGGCRASIYNAVSLEDVETLVGFMRAYEKRHSS
jgi:phosphoserine aminotransferase